MKRNYIRTVGLIVLLFTGNMILRAQDPHFSQYFMSPTTLNAALTGKSTADWKVTANFRSQWWGGSIAPFYTTNAAVEKRFASKANDQSYFGLGLSFLTDASNSGLLKNNYFTAGLAYHIAANSTGTEHFSLGFQVSYANRLLDGSKFEFQSQFGSMGFQRYTSFSDPATSLSNSYVDLNAGAHYSKEEKDWGMGLGFAVFHASTPDASVYQSSSYALPRRYTANGSVYFKSGTRNQIAISTVTDIQGGNAVNATGVVYKIGIQSDQLQGLNLGAWARFGDALYPYLGLEGKSWILGLSYDVITSKLNSSYNSVQSMEISFALKFGKKNVNDRPMVTY